MLAENRWGEGSRVKTSGGATKMYSGEVTNSCFQRFSIREGEWILFKGRLAFSGGNLHQRGKISVSGLSVLGEVNSCCGKGKGDCMKHQWARSKFWHQRRLFFLGFPVRDRSYKRSREEASELWKISACVFRVSCPRKEDAANNWGGSTNRTGGADLQSETDRLSSPREEGMTSRKP